MAQNAFKGGCVPPLPEALASRQDLWGQCALRQINGPSYPFFEKLLPPLRYVNTAFRHYPVVLSVPGAPVKARYVASGSAINATAGTNTWTDAGFPVIFRVGKDDEIFGEDVSRLAVPAWQVKGLVCQNFSLVNGHEPRYSAGNIYDTLCQAECGDTARSLLLAGCEPDLRPMIRELLAYEGDLLAFHNAGHKLQLLADYYWITGDRGLLLSARPQWTKEAERILKDRDPDNGLAPREKYCGDIDTLVYSLAASAAAWRG